MKAFLNPLSTQRLRPAVPAPSGTGLPVRSPLISAVCASLLILLFSYAVASKLLRFRGYVWDMAHQPFPGFVNGILVYLILLAELSAALLLIFGSSRFLGFVLSLILLGLFTVYALAVLAHAFTETPCGCGGLISRLSWPQHLALDILFTGIALLGLRATSAAPA